MTPDKYASMNNQLIEVYRKWAEEIKKEHPKFLEDQYSNPYYACVPNGWIDSNVRILIVGEEGFGQWGMGKSDGAEFDDIDTIQRYNWSLISGNLHCINKHWLYSDVENDSLIKSPFWNRIRKLAEFGICAWTNNDLLHHLGKYSKDCRLSDEERKELHSPNCNVLRNIIEVLNPTHIVFFGWYGVSLEPELPEVFKELYPKGLGDKSKWFKNVVSITNGERVYLFTYHPSWGCRQKGYEDKVMEMFKSSLP